MGTKWTRPDLSFGLFWGCSLTNDWKVKIHKQFIVNHVVSQQINQYPTTQPGAAEHVGEESLGEFSKDQWSEQTTNTDIQQDAMARILRPRP